jgi:hypothetical protein
MLGAALSAPAFELGRDFGQALAAIHLLSAWIKSRIQL